MIYNKYNNLSSFSIVSKIKALTNFHSLLNKIKKYVNIFLIIMKEFIFIMNINKILILIRKLVFLIV